ncbi:MAG: YihY/virulence factor BrkB family protein [Pirellulales bacterium]|nr:YihY/virulence factor BrkB family protein [Pirellulales bacterium]
MTSLHSLRGRFSWRELVLVLKGAFFEWNEDKVPRMAAAIAFYTVFSLTPIIVIVFKIAERTFGAEAALEEMLAQAAYLVGEEGRDAVRLAVATAQPRTATPLSAAIAVAATVFAATGVFTELKDALNTIWEVQARPGLGLMQMIRDRFFAFAMVLVIWFLLLVSLVTSALMAAVSRYASAYFAGVQFVESTLSLAFITLLFALIYRVLPDVKVAWSDVWLGAVTTAGLFVIGKSLFGVYLGHSTLGASYGAAGSLVIVILWVYYSCLIVLFGAEMTQVQSRLHHVPPAPTDKAVHVTEHARVQQGIPRTEDVQEAAQALDDRPT